MWVGLRGIAVLLVIVGDCVHREKCAYMCAHMYANSLVIHTPTYTQSHSPHTHNPPPPSPYPFRAVHILPRVLQMQLRLGWQHMSHSSGSSIVTPHIPQLQGAIHQCCCDQATIRAIAGCGDLGGWGGMYVGGCMCGGDRGGRECVGGGDMGASQHRRVGGNDNK